MDLSVLQIIGLGISILGIAGLAIWSVCIKMVTVPFGQKIDRES